MNYLSLSKTVVMSFMILTSCGRNDGPKKTIPGDGYRYFRITTESNKPFIVRSSDTKILRIADSLLMKPKGERHMMIIGPIDRGDEGYNCDWSWHLKTNEWTFAESAIELCDASPTYVENNLDEWLNIVVIFCPWSSQVDVKLFAGEEVK